jgi:hypothetical protein
MPDGGKDATTDQITPDGPQPDVLVDTGVDGGGGSDGGNNIQNFRVQVAQAFCARFQNCCNNVDAGPFDYSTCVAGITKSGVEGSSLGLPAEVLNGPNVSLDMVEAQACLAGLATLSCPVVDTKEWKPLADHCMNAIVGSLPVNGQCIKPVECQKTAYCNYAVDAGKSDAGTSYGLCANLLQQGAKCGQSSFYYSFNNLYSSEECGYKNWSEPRFCNYDTDPNAAGFFCDKLRSNGTVCYGDNECATGLCVDVTDAGTCGLGTCQCQNTSDYTRFCKDLKIQDAGPG